MTKISFVGLMVLMDQSAGNAPWESGNMPHAAPQHEIFQQQIATGELQPYTQDAWYKATLPRRLVAVLIDALLVLLPAGAAAFFYLKSLPGSPSLHLDFLIGWPLAVFLLYNTCFVRMFGATAGKKIARIAVVNAKYTRPSLPQAFLREVIGKCFSELPFLIGCWSAAWDRNRQTLHDKIADTFVVSKIPDNGRNSRWVYMGLFLQIVVMLLAAAAIMVTQFVHPVGR